MSNILFQKLKANMEKGKFANIEFVIVEAFPLRTEFPVFWEFLGIPRNSQKFPNMQMTLANQIPSFLGISGNSWEFLKIPRNS